VHTRGIEIFEIEETFGVSLPLSRLQLLPVAVRLHGPWFLTGPAQDKPTRHDLRRQRLEGIAIGSATLVSAPTKEILRSVKARFPTPLPNVWVIPNSLRAADEQIKWCFKNCDPSNILFVGRFDQQKGGDLVLRVFAQLASVYPKLTLTFVGPDLGVKGPDNKLQSFQNFMHSTLPESCRSRINFCGHVAHSELSSLRRKSFMTIVASQYETMPYSVLEAMSLGCPIVASRVGGIPEMIEDGRSGLLVPANDPDSMTEACIRFLDSPAFAASVGHQALNKCREFYNPIAVADRTIRAYQSALAIFKSHP
jgi:glycosyltransferase involved in cell wall biosynthesis